MIQSRIAIRYAKALLELSLEKNNTESTFNDMCFINETCSESKSLKALLKSPIVKKDQKAKSLEELFKNKISKTSMNFLLFVVQKKREPILSLISKSFIAQYKKYNGIQEVVVTTAIPLSEEVRSRVVHYIQRQEKTQVELKEIVDQSIIGGIIIRIGDKQIDASIISEITKTRQMFNKNAYLQEI